MTGLVGSLGHREAAGRVWLADSASHGFSVRCLPSPRTVDRRQTWCLQNLDNCSVEDVIVVQGTIKRQGKKEERKRDKIPSLDLGRLAE